MVPIRSLCVYCGSSPGADPAFAEAARQLGRLLARHQIRLIYGGGSLGLMGALASSVLEHGGSVTGIIPEFLTGKEQVLTRAQEVVVTHDMHERKRLMFERADAFAALPGGLAHLKSLWNSLPGPSLADTASRSLSSTSEASGIRCWPCSITCVRWPSYGQSSPWNLPLSKVSSMLSRGYRNWCDRELITYRPASTAYD